MAGSLQASNWEKTVTPADLCLGQLVIMPQPNPCDELLEQEKNPPGRDCVDWYCCCKDLPY